MRNLRYLILICIAFSLVGCVQIPKDAFQLPATSLKDRQTQTRLYATGNEMELLGAGIGVLQDMGYTIDKTEKNLGLIAASKNVDATNAGQVVGAIFLALLGGKPQAIDKEQKIKVCLVTTPSKLDKSGYLARISFQRIVWDSEGKISKVETLTDETLYQGFFEKLSKSVFLEAQQI